METIGPYVIREELGRGGMGVVYRAFDPRVGRDVAIKVLGALGGAVDLERFRREAEAAARVRHPNMVAVHELGGSERGPYLVMDFVDGESLGQRLKRQGPLRGDEVVRFGVELAQALAALHAAGILHRDVKPDNVLLGSDGRPRLTDFGLVRLDDAQRLTATGAALGTPAFMSPEQVAGARAAIDARSDVYGLGATLYSLLVGHPPFRGSSALAVMSQVANEPVTPPSQLGDVDPRVEAIVLRCLEKDPTRRYASALELAEALSGTGQGPEVPRWGVALGTLAIAAVALLLALGLRGTSTSAPNDGQGADPSGVGSAGAARGSAGELGPDERAAPSVLVERGEAALRRGDVHGARKAFERALRVETLHAGALRGLARVHFVWEDPSGALKALDSIEGPPSAALLGERALYLARAGFGKEAIRDAEKALTLEAPSGQALAALARVREELGDLEQALAVAQEALYLEPENVDALVIRSRIRDLYGDQDRARELAGRAIQLEPDNSEARVALAVAVYKLGRHEEAIDALRGILDRFPGHARARYLLGFAYLALGKHGRALEHFDRALELDPGYPPAEEGKAKALFDLGKREEGFSAIRALNHAHPWRADGHRLLAGFCEQTGEPSGAVAALTSAIAVAALPSSSDYYRRGRALRGLGYPGPAVNDFVQAAEVAPERAEVQLAAGALLHELGRYGEAKGFLFRRLQIQRPPPPFEAYYLLAEICGRDRQFTEAIALLDVALPKATTNEQRRDVRYQRAWARDALNHRRAALEDFLEAIRLDPDYAGVERARRRVAQIRAKLDNKKG